MVFRERLAPDPFVERDFVRECHERCIAVHRSLLAMELDLLIDDIVDELTLDHELRGEVLEIPDFLRGDDGIGLHILGDVIEIG